jgi:hypothetical protein
MMLNDAATAARHDMALPSKLLYSDCEIAIIVQSEELFGTTDRDQGHLMLFSPIPDPILFLFDSNRGVSTGKRRDSSYRSRQR